MEDSKLPNSIIQNLASTLETYANRLDYLLTHKGKKLPQFAEIVKIPYGTLYSIWKRGNEPSTETSKRILEAVPEVNPDWWHSGKGQPLRAAVPTRREVANTALATATAKGDGAEVVFVPEFATAGYLAGFGDAEFLQTLPTFKLQGLNLGPGRHHAFPVFGDSMAATINHGDLFVGQLVEDGFAVRPGEVYALWLPDGMVIKRVRFDAGPEHFNLYSDNTQYDPYPVRRADVIAMFRRVLVFDFSSSNRGLGGGLMDRIERGFSDLASMLANGSASE